MKTLRIAASALVSAIAFASFAPSLDAAVTYVPTAKVRASVENVKPKVKAWYDYRVATFGKAQADAQAAAVSDKLGSMQIRAKAKGQRANSWVYATVRQYLQSLVTAQAASAGSQTTKPVTETKQLSANEAKTVVSTVISAGDTAQSQYATAQQLQSVGLSIEDASLMAVKNDFGDGIFFCAPFTGDVYPIESKYSGGNDPSQFAAMDAYDAWETRVIYKGDVFYQPDAITKKNASRVRECANILQNKTQDQMKALFDKLNLTYAVTRKPFYELGYAHKDVDAWVKSLNIGKAK